FTVFSVKSILSGSFFDHIARDRQRYYTRRVHSRRGCDKIASLSENVLAKRWRKQCRIAILMILRKRFPVTFTAPPKGSFDRLFCGRISIACWRKWARKNCVCWMLAVEKGRPQSKWPSVGIRSFYAIFLRR